MCSASKYASWTAAEEKTCLHRTYHGTINSELLSWQHHQMFGRGYSGLHLFLGFWPEYDDGLVRKAEGGIEPIRNAAFGSKLSADFGNGKR